jgi:hypothetical protein
MAGAGLENAGEKLNQFRSLWTSGSNLDQTCFSLWEHGLQERNPRTRKLFLDKDLLPCDSKSLLPSERRGPIANLVDRLGSLFAEASLERKPYALLPTLVPDSQKKHSMGRTWKTNGHREVPDFSGSLASRGVPVWSGVELLITRSRVRDPDGSLIFSRKYKDFLSIVFPPKSAQVRRNPGPN